MWRAKYWRGIAGMVNGPLRKGINGNLLNAFSESCVAVAQHGKCIKETTLNKFSNPNYFPNPNTIRILGFGNTGN